MQYTEVVPGRKHDVKLVWTQAIYVSTKGRLFVSAKREGNSRRANRHADITPGSNGFGGSTPFDWTQSGLAREWIDHTGDTLRQTIEIAQSHGRFTCRMALTRGGFASRAHHEICTVVVGNPLGGS
jgi:hypothetical protein